MSKRIEQIAKFTIGTSAIDIGSDHGYLLINLNTKGFNKLLAIEKNQGPLENCINNLQQEKLGDKIKTLLSDGLQKLPLTEVQKYENIIIAGMGGDLIGAIIKQDIAKFKTSYLILQPNNNEDKLRKILNENNFELIKETIIKENNKYYEIIQAKFCSQKLNTLTAEELIFGQKQNFLTKEFQEKWEEEAKYLQNLINNLEQKNISINPELKLKLKMIEDKRS